jgi:thioredoxin 1
MPVLINYNICDMAAGCPVIQVCPTGAWSYSKERKRPVVDNSKCNDCRLCIKGCPARAVLFALTKQGLSVLQEEIKADPRTEDELFKERFNSDPVDPRIVVNKSNFDKEVLESKKIMAVDFWAPAFASRCRIGAVLYRDITPPGYETKLIFKKVNIEENKDLAKKFQVMAVPALYLFDKGEVIERVYGIQTTSEADLLKERITSALKRVKS